MLGLSGLGLDIEYRTGYTDLASNFYKPCLAVSTKYDRSVGYFRSSVYSVIGPDVLDFARRGGQIRLVCSPDITDEDLQALTSGYEQKRHLVETCLMSELNQLLLDVSARNNLALLATLVTVGILEIRIAFRPAVGIYHEKLGIFYDDYGNVLTFKGSPNESWSAWHHSGNLESFDVFSSWSDGRDLIRTTRHVEYFDSLWGGTAPGVETLSFPDAIATRLSEISHKTLEDCEAMYTKSDKRGKRSPLKHQLVAVENWQENGGRGIFKHATGSGKTYTSSIAIERHCSKGLPAIVIVPSSLLLGQWEKELRAEFPDIPILIVGDGNDAWRRAGRLETFTDPDTNLGARLVLAMAQTASSSEFVKRISPGSHLLLVADEVHRLGSRKNSNVLNIDAKYRLGLSATPERYGDPEGTRMIFDYFGGIVPPVIDLKDAIEAGRLVKYEYHPHPVSLNTDELEQWQQMSKQIIRKCAKEKKNLTSGEMPEEIKLLLIRRARIAKKAVQKIQLAVDIITREYREGQSWLIYCEDIEQLRDVSDALREVGMNPLHYYTAMEGGTSETLQWFTRFGGVLVSIRCLDEGVDIPSVSHAIILASSQNPREFIQRRGRVLRKDPQNPEKRVAVIHDAIVVPDDYEGEPLGVGLLKSELIRAYEFAQDALNQGSQIELLRIAASKGIDLSELHDIGLEVDDND